MKKEIKDMYEKFADYTLRELRDLYMPQYAVNSKNMIMRGFVKNYKRIVMKFVNQKV
ncbi:MAG: hypothetical protein Q8N63_03860 [Nanoarchaeota archaeon]|nr:hypothetical protein [Nanoarchaeota archaeon]